MLSSRCYYRHIPPGFLYDYAFDGAMLAYGPEIKALPGFTFRICYGKGFESGLRDSSINPLNDSSFAGFNIDLYNTPTTLVNVMLTKAFDLPDLPEKATVNIGDVASGGFLVMNRSLGVGVFFATGFSRTNIYGSKIATRGHVEEVYWVYDLTKEPVWKLSRALFRLGYQRYNFKYSGSGLFLGEPNKLDSNPMLLWPSPEHMDNVYLSLDVYF